MSTTKDNAFLKGIQLAKDGLPLERALDRCPWQSVAARSEFIRGWKSVAEKSS